MNIELAKEVLKLKEDMKSLWEKDEITIRLKDETVESIHMMLSHLEIDGQDEEYERIFEALTALLIERGLKSIWQ